MLVEVGIEHDPIHGQLYKPFKKREELSSISQAITATGETKLPNPDGEKKIKLQSNLERFMWYPLPSVMKEKIKCECYVH